MGIEIRSLSALVQRIKKGREKIPKKKLEGYDTRSAEEHLLQLENEFMEVMLNYNFENIKLRIRVGPSGVCSCALTPKRNELCTGCWRIEYSCRCLEMDINPKVELTKQYVRHVSTQEMKNQNSN